MDGRTRYAAAIKALKEEGLEVGAQISMSVLGVIIRKRVASNPKTAQEICRMLEETGVTKEIEPFLLEIMHLD